MIWIIVLSILLSGCCSSQPILVPRYMQPSYVVGGHIIEIDGKWKLYKTTEEWVQSQRDLEEWYISIREDGSVGPIKRGELE